MIIDNARTDGPRPGTARRGRRWRVGVAGAGWVTQYHLPAWRAEAGRAEVVAIADPNPSAVAARREGYDIPRGYASAEAMIAQGNIDILDVCAPPEAHAGMVRLAARRGIAVICQKPLAATLAQAQALVADLDPAHRVMVHDNWRFRSSYRRIKEWLDEGCMGALRSVRLEYLSSGMIADPSGVRPALARQANFATMGRLLVMEVLVHHLDTLRFLLGDLDLVCATTARSNEDIAGEDSATLILRRRNDGLPIVLVGDLAVHGEAPQARDRLRIIGEHGTIDLDGWTLRLCGGAERAEDVDSGLGYQRSYDSAIRHFLDCLDDGRPFEVTPADHMPILALAEAAYEQAGPFPAVPRRDYDGSAGNRGRT